MARVEIITVGSMWCDCGDIFGRYGLPRTIPLDMPRCKNCGVLHFGEILEAMVQRPRVVDDGRR